MSSALLRIARSTWQPVLLLAFFPCFRCARAILPLQCRSASPDRRNVPGRTSDYAAGSTGWPESCTAHPREKRPGRYRARLTFFLPWRFWSADVIAETQTLLTLLRGDRVEGCPPLLNVPAFAVWTDDPALLVLRKCQDFREFFFAGATEKIVSGHDFLPVEKALLKRIVAVRPDSVNYSFSENVTENQENRDAPNQRPRSLRLNWPKVTLPMR